MIAPNDGNRPSRLALARYATGELDGEALRDLEARLDPSARAHLDALDAVRAEMPPLDVAKVRKRAAAIAEGDPPSLVLPPPANDDRGFRSKRWFGLAGGLVAVAAAALATFAVVGPSTQPSVRFRGAEALELYQVVGDEARPYTGGTALGENDVLGFSVVNAGHDGVVLLSVDGTGTVSVFYPTDGDAPAPLPRSGKVPLPDTVILDGAPGPEVFVAVFDRPVSEARAELQRRFQSGGHEAVEAWADEAQGVVAVAVARR